MSLEEQLKKLKESPELKWPEAQDEVFKKRLKHQLHAPPTKVRSLSWIYVAAAVLVLGFIAGQFLFDRPQENALEQQMLQQMAAAEYPSQQLEALANYQELQNKKVDQAFQSTLIGLLNQQTQTNVKLEAIDALQAFGSQPEVRQALLNALTQESEALVQIKLIKTLAELKETRATDPLEQIIADRTQEAAVRNTATLAVATFKNQ